MNFIIAIRYTQLYQINQFISEKNILVRFRAGRKEIFQNKSSEISKVSSLIHKYKLKQNLFRLLLSVLTYAVYLFTYAVYENYHDAFSSFFSHVTILIKYKLKELSRKNYSVTFEEIRNKIHPLNQASGITLSCQWNISCSEDPKFNYMKSSEINMLQYY